MACKCQIVNGTHYHPLTPEKLVTILENLRQSRQRVHFHLGDPQTGVDWMEENDVEGRIGRSTGSCKIPLVIASRNSIGGSSLSTNSIVRISYTTGHHSSIYQVDNYQQPRVTLRYCNMPIPAENRTLRFELFVQGTGTVHARFVNYCSARRYIRNLGLNLKS